MLTHCVVPQPLLFTAPPKAQPLLHGAYPVPSPALLDCFTIFKVLILPYPDTPVGHQDPFSPERMEPGLPHGTPAPCMDLQCRKASVRQLKPPSSWTNTWEAMGFRQRSRQGQHSRVSLLPVPVPGRQSCAAVPARSGAAQPRSGTEPGKRCPAVPRAARSTAPSSVPQLQGQHLPPLSSAVKGQKWKSSPTQPGVTVPSSELWVQQLQMPPGTGSSHCCFL